MSACARCASHSPDSSPTVTRARNSSERSTWTPVTTTVSPAASGGPATQPPGAGRSVGTLTLDEAPGPALEVRPGEALPLHHGLGRAPARPAALAASGHDGGNRRAGHGARPAAASAVEICREPGQRVGFGGGPDQGGRDRGSPPGREQEQPRAGAAGVWSGQATRTTGSGVVGQLEQHLSGFDDLPGPRTDALYHAGDGDREWSCVGHPADGRHPPRDGLPARASGRPPAPASRPDTGARTIAVRSGSGTTWPVRRRSRFEHRARELRRGQPDAPRSRRCRGPLAAHRPRRRRGWASRSASSASAPGDRSAPSARDRRGGARLRPRSARDEPVVGIAGRGSHGRGRLLLRFLSRVGPFVCRPRRTDHQPRAPVRARAREAALRPAAGAPRRAAAEARPGRAPAETSRRAGTRPDPAAEGSVAAATTESAAASSSLAPRQRCTADSTSASTESCASATWRPATSRAASASPIAPRFLAPSRAGSASARVQRFTP